MAAMDVPFPLPLEPMLAKAVAEIPAPDSVPGGLLYEPKWDGFRCLVLKDGEEVELASRGKKPLTRYFPEVVRTRAVALPPRCAVRRGDRRTARASPARQRLDWERPGPAHPPGGVPGHQAGRADPGRSGRLRPAVGGDDDLMAAAPFAERRARLEDVLRRPRRSRYRGGSPPDARHRRRRLSPGTGSPGSRAPAWTASSPSRWRRPYAPGKRTMLKIKHKRTGRGGGGRLPGAHLRSGVGSLLLGLYGDDGRIFNVGGIAAFTRQRRLELVDELAPLVVRDADGAVAHAATDRSRFSANKDVSFVPLRPERVVEVAFDQLEGGRFRHAVQFLRWRPDREPALVHPRSDRPRARLRSRRGSRRRVTAPDLHLWCHGTKGAGDERTEGAQGRHPARGDPPSRREPRRDAAGRAAGDLGVAVPVRGVPLAGLHPRRLARHLREVRREIQLAEATVEVPLPQPAAPARSGRRARRPSMSAQGSPSTATIPGTVRTVNSAGEASASRSQASGIDTGACPAAVADCTPKRSCGPGWPGCSRRRSGRRAPPSTRRWSPDPAAAVPARERSR